MKTQQSKSGKKGVQNRPSPPRKATAQPRSNTVPVAYGSSVRMPSATGSLRGSTCSVHHMEFVRQVMGATVWTVSSIPIQPALTVSFPWLAPIAGSYEKYSFRNLRYDYTPLCPTTSAGSIVLAVDYDVKDLAPLAIEYALSYQGASISPVWKPTSMVCDSSLVRSQLFSRTAAAPANTDLKTYDVGNLHICVSDCAATTAIGYVTVSYDIVLETPHIPDSAQAVEVEITLPNAPSNTPFAGTVAVAEGSKSVFRVKNGNSLEFLEPFEGLLQMGFQGNTIDGNWPPTFVGSNVTKVSPLEWALSSNSANFVGLYNILASPGQILKVATTANYLTKAILRCASGSCFSDTAW